MSDDPSKKVANQMSLAAQRSRIMADVALPSNGNNEPKPPEALNAGRYAERLWGYKDQVGSYSEMGRLYEHDRAEFWHTRFMEATGNETGEWRPIETAPKDRDILLTDGSGPHEGKWLTGLQLQYTWTGYVPPDGWYWAGYGSKPVGPINAKYWMLLPPNAQKASEQRGESRAEFERDRGFVRRCPKCNRDVSSGCNYCACPYPQSPAVSEPE